MSTDRHEFSLPLTEAPLFVLARMVREDWTRVNYAAVPYLNAMASLDSIEDTYGADSGRKVVAYFISNAGAWRGDTARVVKNELRRRLAS